MHTFDEKAILEAMHDLEPWRRTLFALSCATRLIDSYERFHQRTGRGDSKGLRSLAENLWKDLAGAEMTTGDVEAGLEAALALLPDEKAYDTISQPYAEDAAAALAYAFQARKSGDPQYPAWAARRVYEAVDSFVVAETDAVIGESETEQKIVAHPLVQAELARQERDIELLEAADFEAPQLEAMRQRGIEEGQRLFTPLE
ncbi:MAG: DUF416 family protein [Acidobacteriota bacterium]